GPTATERAAGMSSAVPAGTTLRSLKISGGLAVVDLSGTFASGGGSFSMGARMAQLVTTLTQFPTVSKVRLWLDGKPATTLGGEGLVVDHPVGRGDIEEWLPGILVDSPAAGASITSPVRVRGSANVFEAVFFVQVTDWDGRIVATRRVMASSGTGTRGTFDVTVSYKADRAGQGALVAYSHSPKDGARINVVEIPLRVAP
ncbi:MAG: Gmad2 immunoglobulin-like domain-containing protein, partial [Mycobacteriales bacterium]